MVYLMALHLVGLSVGLVQAFQFLVSNRHYGAVARMEVHAHGVVYNLEVVEVGRFCELVASVHIDVVHQYILVGADELERPGTFDSLVGLLLVVG